MAAIYKDTVVTQYILDRKRKWACMMYSYVVEADDMSHDAINTLSVLSADKKNLIMLGRCFGFEFRSSSFRNNSSLLPIIATSYAEV